MKKWLLGIGFILVVGCFIAYKLDWFLIFKNKSNFIGNKNYEIGSEKVMVSVYSIYDKEPSSNGFADTRGQFPICLGMKIPRGTQYSFTWKNTNICLDAGALLGFGGKECEGLLFEGHGYYENITKGDTIDLSFEDCIVRLMPGAAVDCFNFLGERDIAFTLVKGMVSLSHDTTAWCVLRQPGERISLHDTTGGWRVRPASTGNVTAWMNGKFQYENIRIQDLIKVFSAYYGKKVIYKGSIPQIIVTHTIKRNISLENQLTAITKSTGVRFQVARDSLLVLPYL